MAGKSLKTLAVTYFFKVNQDTLKQVMKSYIIIGKDEVASSNPAISSIKPVRNDWFSYAFWGVFAGFGVESCKNE